MGPFDGVSLTHFQLLVGINAFFPFSVTTEVCHVEITGHEERCQEKACPDSQGKEKKQAGKEAAPQRF
jgi:hypothetical protein